MLKLLQTSSSSLDKKKYQLLLSLIRMYQLGNSQYLNFYGPPHTIPTIPYYEIVNQHEINVKGKAVFVGNSMKDRVTKMRRQQGLVQQGWDDVPNDQYACTIAACKTQVLDEERPRRPKPKTDPGLKPWEPLIISLLERQRALGAALPSERLLSLDALATAPFTTGLGNEHPLENGFAFLNPYGLPYLPGSGVKGVLRQAARELASGEWRDHAGWNDEERYILQAGKKRISLSVLDVLFGKESDDGDTDHVRGSLSFWDVIPQITSDHLMVEIMTPHQKHYYQDGQSPNESGQPNPISFLTVPPGSGFTFHVLCDRAHLARLTKSRVEGVPDLLTEGPTHWKTLLTDAFEHAFAWLGLGAKTAVGYGAMVWDRRAEEAELDRRLGHTADGLRRLDAKGFQDRRDEVNDVAILGPKLAAGLDPPGP